MHQNLWIRIQNDIINGMTHCVCDRWYRSVFLKTLRKRTEGTGHHIADIRIDFFGSPLNFFVSKNFADILTPAFSMFPNGSKNLCVLLA